MWILILHKAKEEFKICLSSSRFELETVCVLDRRDNQLHHEDIKQLYTKSPPTKGPGLHHGDLR